MTIQTAAQVHFIFKKRKKEKRRCSVKTPPRTPGGRFGQTEARCVIKKKPTAAQSKSTKALKGGAAVYKDVAIY